MLNFAHLLNEIENITVSEKNNHFVAKENVLLNIDEKRVEMASKFIKDFVVPDWIEEIGDFAFAECFQMESVGIPDSVKKIGECAFYNCKSLKEIKFPNALIEILNHTCCYCESLERVILPSSIETIEYHAFSHCEALSEIYSFAINPPGSQDDYVFDWSGKAVVYVPKESIELYRLSIGWSYFDDFRPIEDTELGVQSPPIDQSDDAPIYNMLGVRVNADAKGILIQNGKKFIRK
ncbi:MAG: leucine-rich repeat domain-containing protein [Muribaculum sp.]|nr:leucine-rich repeat domain-containing protein [Muribaculum sp.]